MSTNKHKRKGSFKQSIFTLVELLNTNLQGIPIPLHSCLQFSPPHANTTKFASTRTVNSRLLRCFWPSSQQICRLHYQAPVLHVLLYFPYCRFPNIFTDVVSPNISFFSSFESHINFSMFELTPRLLPTFQAWLLSTRLFCFNGAGISTLWRVFRR